MTKIGDIIPLLRQFGITPEQLGPDRLNKLLEISSQISDPTKITPAISQELIKAIGVSARKQSKPKKADPKIGRNDPCNCGSNKKYKKCCFK
jgi:uncharacterized protein YecA (UPF0149 family)